MLAAAVVCGLVVVIQGVALKETRVATSARMKMPISSFAQAVGLHTVGKRSTCGNPSLLTDAERTEALDMHNYFRKQETNAADMIQMEYRDDIAARAQELADQCVWEHGLTSMCDGEGLGQNMYITSGWKTYPSLSVTSALTSWYNEKSDYTFSSTTCASGKMCGHYTQMVWASSSAVGCGVARCPTVDMGGYTWSNAVLFVCNYAPGGNYYGQQPYTLGTPCSACANSMGASSGAKCVNDMCVSYSPQDDSSCSCLGTSTCMGRGTYNTGTCTCDCNTGYYGDECQNSCECSDAVGYEHACPQWTVYCNNPYYSAFMYDTCKKTCGLCATPAGVC